MTRTRHGLCVMRAAGVAAAVVCALVPAAALAASGPMSGVHVDPGSPAGKQYAVPITIARGETSGRPSGSGATSPPPFGVGVTPVTTPARATPSSTRPVTGVRAAKLHRTQLGRRSHRQSTVRAIAPARARAGATAGTSAPARTRARTAAPTGAPARTQAGHRFSVASVNTNSWLALVAGGALVLLLGGGGGLALRRRVSEDR